MMWNYAIITMTISYTITDINNDRCSNSICEMVDVIVKPKDKACISNKLAEFEFITDIFNKIKKQIVVKQHIVEDFKLVGYEINLVDRVMTIE